MRNFTYLLSGALFSIGLVVSGMTQPSKVVAFLDLFGNWDPSLIFVMAGAISVHLFAYRAIRNRTSAVFSKVYWIPNLRKIDKKLVLGSVMFGTGWGLAGYCPGPALVSLLSLDKQSLLFTASMLLSMFVYGLATSREAGWSLGEKEVAQ